MFTAQPEEGILSSKSQNGDYVFVVVVLTCYNGTSKICVLEDTVDFAFGFDLSLKYYFAIYYVLLIFCVLLASFSTLSFILLCFHCIFLLRGGESCWFVFKINNEIFALSGDFFYMK